MFMPGSISTWVVMLQRTTAVVFASGPSGSALTRVQRMAAETEAELDRKVAACLDSSRRAGQLGRWFLVAAEPRIAQFRSAVSPATRKLLTATRSEDLTSVLPEDMRDHVPEQASL